MKHVSGREERQGADAAPVSRGGGGTFAKTLCSDCQGMETIPSSTPRPIQTPRNTNRQSAPSSCGPTWSPLGDCLSRTKGWAGGHIHRPARWSSHCPAVRCKPTKPTKQHRGPYLCSLLLPVVPIGAPVLAHLLVVEEDGPRRRLIWGCGAEPRGVQVAEETSILHGCEPTAAAAGTGLRVSSGGCEGDGAWVKGGRDRRHLRRRGSVCPVRHFYYDFPRFSPQVRHYPMKPPSRPTDVFCLPNEATNHPCTTLN